MHIERKKMFIPLTEGYKHPYSSQHGAYMPHSMFRITNMSDRAYLLSVSQSREGGELGIEGWGWYMPELWPLASYRILTRCHTRIWHYEFLTHLTSMRKLKSHTLHLHIIYFWNNSVILYTHTLTLVPDQNLTITLILILILIPIPILILRSYTFLKSHVPAHHFCTCTHDNTTSGSTRIWKWHTCAYRRTKIGGIFV